MAKKKDKPIPPNPEDPQAFSKLADFIVSGASPGRAEPTIPDNITINGVELIIDSYTVPGTFRWVPVTFQRTVGPYGVKWAIFQGDNYCMNNKGKWEDQPLPSSRTDAFLKRCRFATLQDAVNVWIKSGKTGWLNV